MVKGPRNPGKPVLCQAGLSDCACHPGRYLGMGNGGDLEPEPRTGGQTLSCAHSGTDIVFIYNT